MAQWQINDAAIRLADFADHPVRDGTFYIKFANI